MKKCLILCMSCNIPFFQKEEKLISQTWGKDVFDGKYPNINIAIYSASEDGKYHYNKNTHKLLVPSGDGLFDTFEKTKFAFKAANSIAELKDYDFILRTNTSCYINIKLLNNLLDILDENLVYCSEPQCCPNATAPFNWAPHPMGSCMILSKKYISVILDDENLKIAKEMDKTENPDQAMFTVDDTTIGSILNCYWLRNNESILDHYKYFGLCCIYAYNELHPVYPFFLAYSIRLYNSDYNERCQRELKEIINFHVGVKDRLLDEIAATAALIETNRFKILSPKMPTWVVKDELIKFYKENKVWENDIQY